MLTSTTAPGKTFSSRSELADHYKSDWHKYNLKRREAGLPLLEEGDFMARWEAALALRKEQKEGKSGTGHLKQKQRPPSKKKKQPFAQVSSSSSSNNNNANKERKGDDDNTDDDDDDKDAKTPKGDESSSSAPATTGKRLPQKLVESQENPTIDPFLSLFDNNRSMTLEENVEYMRLKYGFFIPDRGTDTFVFVCVFLCICSCLCRYGYSALSVGFCCLDFTSYFDAQPVFVCLFFLLLQ